MRSRPVLCALAFVLAAVTAIAQESPPGIARLEVTYARSTPRGASSAVVSFLVPIDGKSHEFRSGREVPVQTKINMVTTMQYVDVTTRVRAILTPLTSNSVQYVSLRGEFQDVHLVELLGVPFALAEGAILDATRCRGTWLIPNGASRQVCSASRRTPSGKVEVRIAAKLFWSADQWKGAPFDVRGTSTTDATIRITSGTDERLQSVTCDAIPGETGNCESRHGKEIPLVTTSEGAKTTSYIDASTRIHLEASEGGGTHLEAQGITLEPPTDTPRPDMTHLRSTRQRLTIPAKTTSIDGLTLTRFVETGKPEMTLNLERYRRIVPAIGAK